MHPACLPLDALLAQCEMWTGRRGGPGGQHRNKVETAVRWTHVPTGISAEASERRSQSANRDVAAKRLRLSLAIKHRTLPKEVSQSASELWNSRRIGTRLVVSEKHFDYAALLSEALDQLDKHEDNVAQTAALLGITSSQLIKFLRQHPPAFAHVNSARQTRGLHLLH